MEALRIEFPSVMENIRMVESFIDNAKEKFQISDDVYGNIMVAVTESVNNAIVHGNHNDINKNVSLVLTMNNNVLKCLVEDEGNGFDYENLPDPTAPENLNKVGGRGVFLIKNLSDGVAFLDGGKKIEMTFNIN
ncbi:MAG: ATP-binding protein [Bacteroidota bacterium]|nr:ATP-binding protein [Bacteroidota bacterium]